MKIAYSSASTSLLPYSFSYFYPGAKFLNPYVLYITKFLVKKAT
ncbi:hypothetical protein HMPREF0322_02946 [Desulfitobacterium hafniense DP7]|uniref:Uncharacterized protein n=1 Tax=Desulfitobacterium hafniense DP7 TaxID=537010 RepID=G9XPP9_DESHA|nr:hypothetical protein HMPREF0322_02946 [Desulfitobacterium hafniense DP7]